MKKLEEKAAQHLYKHLAKNNNKKLLLLSGGSALKVCPYLFDELLKLDDLSFLEICMQDERISTNVQDSNYWQLEQLCKDQLTALAGKGCTIIDIKNLAESGAGAAEVFAKYLQEKISAKYNLVAINGIGQDMHTAGIFPLQVSKYESTFLAESKLAIYHQFGPQATPSRLTVSPAFLKHLHVVAIFATGTDKEAMLSKLAQTTLNFFEVPILHILKSNAEITLFTDQNIQKLSQNYHLDVVINEVS